MLYTDFTVGEKSYKLRLNTRNIITLEKQLGNNPLSIFGDGDKLPTITEMVNVLYASLQQYQHNISLNDAFDIFDEYIESGNTATDFIAIILDIYKTSGLIKMDAEEDIEKN